MDTEKKMLNQREDLSRMHKAIRRRNARIRKYKSWIKSIKYIVHCAKKAEDNWYQEFVFMKNEYADLVERYEALLTADTVKRVLDKQ